MLIFHYFVDFFFFGLSDNKYFQVLHIDNIFSPETKQSITD